MLLGEYRHGVDAKGRVFFPQRLREETGSLLILCRGLEKNIMVYAPDEWDKFTAKIDALPFTEARKLRQFFVAKAAECSVDAQGRLVIPQFMRAYADISKDVVIAGVAEAAEIWNAELWDAKMDEMDGNDIAAIMERNHF